MHKLPLPLLPHNHVRSPPPPTTSLSLSTTSFSRSDVSLNHFFNFDFQSPLLKWIFLTMLRTLEFCNRYTVIWCFDNDLTLFLLVLQVRVRNLFENWVGNLFGNLPWRKSQNSFLVILITLVLWVLVKLLFLLILVPTTLFMFIQG